MIEELRLLLTDLLARISELRQENQLKRGQPFHNAWEAEAAVMELERWANRIQAIIKGAQ